MPLVGELGWLLLVLHVLFAPIREGSLWICPVCWMLCTALYGSTSLQQSSKGSCSLLVSGHNLQADCQWRTLVPPLNSGANAAPASVLALVYVVGGGDEWSYPSYRYSGAQNPLSGERRKALIITHHALSPPPSHHHLYIIHLINWLQRFYRITMSLKRPFVPKSDVKQWFTITTACLLFMFKVTHWICPCNVWFNGT